MWIQQMFVALLCVLLASQQITAVVNNAQSAATEEKDNASNASNEETSSNSENVADSVAASSEKEANRREAPLQETYGAPVPHEVYGPPPDSYIPSSPSNPGLPVPIYGVPDSPTNNIIYPPPIPDIPPPISGTYGPPKEVYGLPNQNLNIFRPPTDNYGPPPQKYGPPSQFSFPKPPKPFNPPPFHKPKPHYGPPRPQYGPPHPKPHFKPKPNYGPPKPQYGPPKPHFGPPPKPHYGPPIKFSGPPQPFYGPPKDNYGPPRDTFHGPPKEQYGPPPPLPTPIKDIYGPPKLQIPPKDVYGPTQQQYGPPEPIPHGPPHPGAPAPPTPPDIKYDGWQPIPGLVSRPPSGTYGAPHGDAHSNHINHDNHVNHGDLQFNGDFVPPPIAGHAGVSSLSLGSSYGSSAGISDSYGAPLNTVTGSGGIVSTSGDSHIHSQETQSALTLGLSAAGIGGGHDGQLSVIKSIGYEIFPNGGASGGYINGGGSAGFINGGLSYSSGGSAGHSSGGSLSFSSGGSSGHSSGGSSSYNSGGSSGHSSGGSLSFSSGGSSGHSSGGSSNYNSGGSSSYNSGGSSSYSGGSSSIFNTGGSFSSGNFNGGSIDFTGGDTYSAPPLNSYSPNGPYAASHSYKNHGIGSSFNSNFGSFGSSFNSGFGKGLSLSSTGIGLIPPSGVYGVPPSGQYGTPLIGHNLNALDLNPPKRPIVFRKPVPHGLIQSIGNHVAQKDAAGVIETSNNFNGPAYIPPPVLEVGNQEPIAPSTLYSLPHTSNPISFQSVSHDGSGNSFNFQHSSSNSAHASALTSYSSVGNLDTSYSAPVGSGHGQSVTVSLDHSLPPATIDLTHYGVPSFGGGLPHDCSAHKSQPLPQLTYGVPSANSYTASLSSLKTNIGGNQYSSLNYGTDLQAAHSQQNSVSNGASVNVIEETSKEQYGKSLAESFAPGGELIKSQSIDFNNIPIQGALGSYTLQIQAADGAAGTHPSSLQVPHDQVLNDGLLQSILAAIEQPQQKDANIYGQPLLLQSDQRHAISGDLQLPSSDIQYQFKAIDDEAQQSIKNQIVIAAPARQDNNDNESSTTEATKTSEADASLQLIDNNEIALYFHNNPQEIKDQQTKETESSEVRNGQQYGSYVSFKTPNTSYVYGDLKSETPTQEK